MTRRDHSDVELVEAALRRDRGDSHPFYGLLLAGVLFGWLLLALILALVLRLLEVARA